MLRNIPFLLYYFSSAECSMYEVCRGFKKLMRFSNIQVQLFTESSSFPRGILCGILYLFTQGNYSGTTVFRLTHVKKFGLFSQLVKKSNFYQHLEKKESIIKICFLVMHQIFISHLSIRLFSPTNLFHLNLLIVSDLFCNRSVTSKIIYSFIIICFRRRLTGNFFFRNNHP